MAVLELLVVLCLIYGLIVLGGEALSLLGRSLEHRAELKRLKEEREARLEAAQLAKDVVDELMLDETLAEQVLNELEERRRLRLLKPKK